MNQFYGILAELEVRGGALISNCIVEALGLLRGECNFKKVCFIFNGTRIEVSEGDTLAKVEWRYGYARGDYDMYGPTGRGM